MTTRISNAVVVFRRPFILDGFGEVQPAGPYSIDTEEEESCGSPGSSTVWRHLITSIRLMRHGAAKYVSVDPDALVAALERDNAQADHSSLEKAARSRRPVGRKLNGSALGLWK